MWNYLSVLEAQIEKLLMSIKTLDKSFPITPILLYSPWYNIATSTFVFLRTAKPLEWHGTLWILFLIAHSHLLANPAISEAEVVQILDFYLSFTKKPQLVPNLWDLEWLKSSNHETEFCNSKSTSFKREEDLNSILCNIPMKHIITPVTTLHSTAISLTTPHNQCVSAKHCYFKENTGKLLLGNNVQLLI